MLKRFDAFDGRYRKIPDLYEAVRYMDSFLDVYCWNLECGHMELFESCERVDIQGMPCVKTTFKKNLDSSSEFDKWTKSPRRWDSFEEESGRFFAGKTVIFSYDGLPDQKGSFTEWIGLRFFCQRGGSAYESLIGSLSFMEAAISYGHRCYDSILLGELDSLNELPEANFWIRAIDISCAHRGYKKVYPY